MVIRVTNIAPGMLEWAIIRAGFAVDDFLRQNEDVREWIVGEKTPTLLQLQSFSSKVHVPFGYLFLPSPPIEDPPIPFFRGAANRSNLHINIYETVLTLKRRQEWLSSYLFENAFETQPYVGVIDVSNSFESNLGELREILNIPEDWAFGLARNEQAVNFIAERLEELGVIVQFSGIVGFNTHRTIPVDECRGFSLVDNIAPFIFVNSVDSKTAQLFTLIHEFVHILIGFSSGYGTAEDAISQNINETFCDKLAAEYLVPTSLLKKTWRGIEQTSKKFKVSRLVIARRALDIGIISRQDFYNFYNAYLNEPVIAKKVSDGGNFFASARKRLGYTFTAHLDNAVKTNQISTIEAYRLTGLYGDTYNKMLRMR